MKEKPDPPTDAILEECYRIKAEINDQFNSMEELSTYMKEIEKREKTQGRKFISPPPPPPNLLNKTKNVRNNEDKVSDYSD